MMEVDLGLVPPGEEEEEMAGSPRPEPRPENGSSPGLPPASSSSSSHKSNNNKKPHRRGKHKGGRRHHRQWKPYFKMSWEEKKALEERETRRACQKREERFASGQPMAPYNTTQFLMEQHEPSEVNLAGGGGAGGGMEANKKNINKSCIGGEEGSGSASADPSSEEYYSSPDDEEIFLEKEFTEAYENYHAERLLTLNKDELVREYLELETKVERLEKRSRQQTNNGRLSSGGEETRENGQENSPPKLITDKINSQSSQSEKLAKLEAEVSRLREENEGLRKDNLELRQSQVSNSVNVGEP